jgi:hypothetical protein
MLIYFVPRVVSKLVVDIQRYVFFYPFAIHTSCLLLRPVFAEGYLSRIRQRRP